RISSDDTTNTRGREILHECDRLNLCILNGTRLKTASPGRLTSWQPAGESTIDYTIVSKTLLTLVNQFHVEIPTPDPRDNWVNHMQISLKLDVSA
ncbi:hypothetical protein C8R45DRAFT_804498, partial [Mycena sanguinolenta]